MTTLNEVRRRAESDAQTHGYSLNPDPKFLENLLQGLLSNEERYGYPSCPCRLASGRFQFDRDITCPCDYRDPDVEEFGYCYCALYVRRDVQEGRTPIVSIPERRSREKQARAYNMKLDTSKHTPSQNQTSRVSKSEIKMHMWYCKQCGYVCFREDPPYVCPICRAKREMFAQININPT